MSERNKIFNPQNSSSNKQAIFLQSSRQALCPLLFGLDDDDDDAEHRGCCCFIFIISIPFENLITDILRWIVDLSSLAPTQPLCRQVKGSRKQNEEKGGGSEIVSVQF